MALGRLQAWTTPPQEATPPQEERGKPLTYHKAEDISGTKFAYEKNDAPPLK